MAAIYPNPYRILPDQDGIKSEKPLCLLKLIVNDLLVLNLLNS